MAVVIIWLMSVGVVVLVVSMVDRVLTDRPAVGDDSPADAQVDVDDHGETK